MTPKLDLSGLKKVKAWEYLLRFAVGGAITVGAGLVAKQWGPLVGGLFLAFPAILPASLTLVKQHDGRQKATEDARGGRLGSVALMAFAVVVWRAAPHFHPVVTLAAATAVWVMAAVGLWFVRYGTSR